MIKRFISYYRPHRLLLFADLLAALLASLIAILYPIITRRMLSDFIPNRLYRSIIAAGALLLALYFIRMLLNYFMQFYGHVMGVRMQQSMRRDMFEHLEQLPYSYYDGHETGEIMSRITSDLMDISELAHHGPENVIISFITVVISFIYLIRINLPLTLIIFSCVPVLLILSAFLRKKQVSAFRECRRTLAEINASIESSVSGIRVTKAYCNAEKEKEKFEVGNSRFASARFKAYRAMGQFHAGTTFVTDIFNVAVLIAGGLFLYSGSITLGDYSAFIVSVGLFITPITTLINFMEVYQDGISGFERFVEIMDTETERDTEGAIDAEVLRGEIELQDVCSSYDDNKPVLRGISLSIKQGSKIALVGPSGGGKTTVCHLIPRFYSLSSGRITIDGVDISHYTLSSLRRNIGIVQQDVFLFNASIRDNILYGRQDATEEEVIEAAKNASIHDYVMSLPQGYDTVIGERGVRLSGGQKQRLSIARVFLKNPAILILDEATSALDNTTEILIQEALDRLSRGRTTIVVAHRLSTVRNADEIAVISDGRIIEQGSHEELISEHGVYERLYSLQFREEDTADLTEVNSVGKDNAAVGQHTAESGTAKTK